MIFQLISDKPKLISHWVDFQTAPAKLLAPAMWKTRFHPRFLMVFDAFSKTLLAGLLLGTILWKGDFLNFENGITLAILYQS